MGPLELSRIQFGDTAAFHILWPLMSIGFALYMFVMEALWLYTNNESFYRQARFWAKIFVLTFAIGVASGFPLSVQFGTNWAAFATATGSFFGNILGFETTIAFTLETASLGILLFGWRRVPRFVHLLSSFGVLFGATLSAFWIMVANSWMQAPHGVRLEKGVVVIDSYREAIFNANAFVSFGHMWVACVESTLFMIMGICAWTLLVRSRDKKTHTDTHTKEQQTFFLNTFTYCLALVLCVSVIQVGLGHVSGQVVATSQPEKLAALELHHDTNMPGTGAPLALIAWPNTDNSANTFAITMPDTLSVLTTNSASGEVVGSNSFAPDMRPTRTQSILVFYAFRLMLLIGFSLVGLALLGSWYWYRGWLTLEEVLTRRMFLRLWVWAMPLGFVATEAGWMTREIGRQPWILYHLMRTSEGLSSNLSTPVIGVTIVAITLVYTLLSVLFIYFVQRIVRTGPDLHTAI